jgi:LacI family transcriptional regulator
VRKWTISDIAREARVSKTTVSRVLNDRPDVDADTSERVRAVVKGLGFVQNVRAVQLATGRADAIGLLASFDVSPWFVEVLRGALEQVQATDLSLTLHAYPESEEASERFIGQLRGGLVDALLVVAPQRPLPILEPILRDRRPVLLLNDHGFNEGGPTIAPDDATGIAEAVQHLVKVGRKRFAMIVGPPDVQVSGVRLAAYRAALIEHGFQLDEELTVMAPFAPQDACRAARELIERGRSFDALFASSDAMAVGAIRALHEHGLHIPRDVSLIGFDDFPSAEFTDPPLTTIRYPLYEMSTRAAKNLIAAMQQREPISATREIVSTHLVIRGSSDPANRGH